jgi:P27 family predicted phage terminase small subunit
MKILAGNPGKRPLNTEEPQAEVPTEAFDAPPAELDENAAAQAEWRRLAPLLRKSRQVTESDKSALIAMCLEWSRYLEATKKIRQHGMVIKAPSGYPIVNPYLSIATKALASCSKLWPELGLTPSSRSRVKAVEATDTLSPLAVRFFGRRA